MAGDSAAPLTAQKPQSKLSAPKRQGRRIIDAHVHLWMLPRNAPPMSDNATFPTGCCGSVPWMEVNRMPADYDATPAGPAVDKLVLIESSVGVTPAPIVNRALELVAEERLRGMVLNGAQSAVPGWLRRIFGL